MTPDFEFMVIRDIKHELSDVEIPKFLIQELEALQSNIVEVEGIIEGDVFDSGEIGVYSFIENTDFRNDV